VLLNFSSENNETARNVESNEIMKKIKENDYVILLDERGKQINNDNLLQKINLNKNIVFIIGGPYGVNEQLRQRANFI
jgi:23S rRNA (pseudouridine1915-N3)-methyltransferase